MIFPFHSLTKKKFQALTDPHIQLLYNMALRYCGNSYDAEDILQESMYIAYKNRKQLKDEGKCKAWLLTILRRQYLKEIRQNASRPTAVEDISSIPQIEAHISSDHCLALEKKEAAERVRHYLAELPENYQTPTLLYYMDDMSYMEIAHALDMPMGTVMSRLSRARQLLKKKLLQPQKVHSEKNIITLYPQNTSRRHAHTRKRS